MTKQQQKREAIVEAVRQMESDVERMRVEKQLELADDLDMKVETVEKIWREEDGP